MKLYTGAALASRRIGLATEVSTRVISVLAENHDEALGKSLKMGREALPTSDGWVDHNVECSQIDDLTFFYWATAYGYTPQCKELKA